MTPTFVYEMIANHKNGFEEEDKKNQGENKIFQFIFLKDFSNLLLNEISKAIADFMGKVVQILIS